MSVRIYEVRLEHRRWGTNYTSRTVAARTCSEAIKKAESGESSQLRAESVRLIAEAEK